MKKAALILSILILVSTLSVIPFTTAFALSADELAGYYEFYELATLRSNWAGATGTEFQSVGTLQNVSLPMTFKDTDYLCNRISMSYSSSSSGTCHVYFYTTDNVTFDLRFIKSGGVINTVALYLGSTSTIYRSNQWSIDFGPSTVFPSTKFVYALTSIVYSATPPATYKQTYYFDDVLYYEDIPEPNVITYPTTPGIPVGYSFSGWKNSQGQLVVAGTPLTSDISIYGYTLPSSKTVYYYDLFNNTITGVGAFVINIVDTIPVLLVEQGANFTYYILFCISVLALGIIISIVNYFLTFIDRRVNHDA